MGGLLSWLRGQATLLGYNLFVPTVGGWVCCRVCKWAGEPSKVVCPGWMGNFFITGYARGYAGFPT